MKDHPAKLWIGVGCSAIALFFVWRSFYGMRIPTDAKN